MGRRVFVTGANGRVGQALIRALVARGDRVVGLARSADKARAVEALGAECLVGDMDAASELDRGLEGAELVFHLVGGLRGPGAETPDQINRGGMEKLLAAVDRVGTGTLQALVFTSSSAVYGDRSGLVLGEEMPPQPDTAYGQSKVEAEKLLLKASADRGVPGRVVRLAAVYGEGFPFMLVDQIRAGKARLPGEGRNHVPTIHVDDAVQGLLRVADRGQDGRIYNLSDTDPVTLKQFYSKVHSLVGGKPVWFWSTWVPSYAQLRIAAVNERLASRLGRNPRLTPDNIKLFRANSRLRTDRIQGELEMSWRFPSALDGLQAVLGGD